MKSIGGFLLGVATTLILLEIYIRWASPLLWAAIEEHGPDSTIATFVNAALPLAFGLGCYAACLVARRHETRFAFLWTLAGISAFAGGRTVFSESLGEVPLPAFALSHWHTWFMLFLLVATPYGWALYARDRGRRRSAEDERAEALGELGAEALEGGVKIAKELHKHLDL